MSARERSGGECPECGLLRLDLGLPCPACRATSLGDAAAAGAQRGAWTPVWRADDEWTALTLQSELESQGIITWVRPLGVAGYPCRVGWMAREWGVVLVPRADLPAATEIVADLMGPDAGSMAKRGW